MIGDVKNRLTKPEKLRLSESEETRPQLGLNALEARMAQFRVGRLS